MESRREKKKKESFDLFNSNTLDTIKSHSSSTIPKKHLTIQNIAIKISLFFVKKILRNKKKKMKK